MYNCICMFDFAKFFWIFFQCFKLAEILNNVSIYPVGLTWAKHDFSLRCCVVQYINEHTCTQHSFDFQPTCNLIDFICKRTMYNIKHCIYNIVIHLHASGLYCLWLESSQVVFHWCYLSMFFPGKTNHVNKSTSAPRQIIDRSIISV